MKNLLFAVTFLVAGCAHVRVTEMPCVATSCAQQYIDVIDLARRLQGRSLGSLPQEQADALMPESYRFSNPNGRPYHDDWAMAGVSPVLQPQTRVRRMDTTYMLPLPLKLVWSKGGVKPNWIAWQEGYPGGGSPDAQFRPMDPSGAAYDLATRFGKPITREVLAYDPVLPPGAAALFAVYLDGEWRPCYYTATAEVLGKRVYYNFGLKPDMTWGDFMTNWPEASLTFKEIK